jgi:hypothetical protein
MENTCDTKPKPANFREFIKSGNFWKPFLSVVIGGILGFLYYHFVGCSSGTCQITGNPYGSTIMGGFMGYFVTNSPCCGSK